MIAFAGLHLGVCLGSSSKLGSTILPGVSHYHGSLSEQQHFVLVFLTGLVVLALFREIISTPSKLVAQRLTERTSNTFWLNARHFVVNAATAFFVTAVHPNVVLETGALFLSSR